MKLPDLLEGVSRKFGICLDGFCGRRDARGMILEGRKRLAFKWFCRFAWALG
jgi:hypothetical protein